MSESISSNSPKRNQPSEAELLAKAKEHMRLGDEAATASYRTVAEALALSWKLHKTPQRRMAEANNMVK